MSDSTVQVPMTMDHDLMRTGLTSAKAETTKAHAVELVQEDYDRNQNKMTKHMLMRAFGSHLPMKLQMEETILSQFRRGPGVPNSMIGLETAMGIDENIDYQDFMNVPSNSTDRIDAYAILEKRFDGPARK